MNLNYRTSWIGNSYSGKDDKWVQIKVKDIYVDSDGTVYTNSSYDGLY